uniref:Nucleolar protein 11 n=1 Tax=Myripristis murdjan TaxID=586833 RepID=A0A668A7F7_9TELE
MAALYEGYTLCGLVQAQNQSDSGIQGIESERDSDHVVVTDSTRSVTLYKVSDQKPLGSWTVKQGQTLTCSAVYNSHTKEYVAVSDNKVIRVWKEEDIILDKAFKATVSSDVWRVHSVPGGEPVVLFQRGAVRLLDSLLSAPQQPVEEVLAQEEAIRWSTTVIAEAAQFVIFQTEQKGDHFLYLQRPNLNAVQRYRLEREEPGLSPLSFSASYRDKHINLLYLYPNGHVYQSVVSVRGPGMEEEAQALPLPRNLLFALPVGEGLLGAASALALDEAHVAVVGVPHPSAGAGKDFLCIWNTNFQTLQAGKEMSGKIYGQLWSYSSKLFIPHGKSLSVIPYECPKSSLASALGKLRQARTEGEMRKIHTNNNTEIKRTAPVEEVQREVEGLLSRSDIQELQPSVGQLASSLVSRSVADPAFYTPGTLAQLVHTQCLCHSVCPDLLLLALERKDYFLCQLCLQLFPDVPEAVTCACLKTFIRCSEKLSIVVVDAQGAVLPTVFFQHGLEVLQTAYSDTFLLPHLKDLSSQQVILFLQYLQFLYLRYSQDTFTQTHGLRSPTLTQIMDWVCLLLDAHFTVLVMTPEAKGLLLNLHRFVKSQVRLFSELGKIEGSLEELQKIKVKKEVGQYSIEVIELF